MGAQLLAEGVEPGGGDRAVLGFVGFLVEHDLVRQRRPFGLIDAFFTEPFVLLQDTFTVSRAQQGFCDTALLGTNREHPEPLVLGLHLGACCGALVGAVDEDFDVVEVVVVEPDVDFTHVLLAQEAEGGVAVHVAANFDAVVVQDAAFARGHGVHEGLPVSDFEWGLVSGPCLQWGFAVQRGVRAVVVLTEEVADATVQRVEREERGRVDGGLQHPSRVLGFTAGVVAGHGRRKVPVDGSVQALYGTVLP